MDKEEEKLPWTDERVTLLKQRWKEGHSSGQIARELGGVTRNAVVGKIHRLNLQGRAAPKKEQKEKVVKPSKPTSVKSEKTASTSKPAVLVAEAIVPLKLPEPEPLVIVRGQRVTILHLSDKTCKWPIGEPGTDDFCFCGHKPRDKSPYCEFHTRAAYQPMQDRRHRIFG